MLSVLLAPERSRSHLEQTPPVPQKVGLEQAKEISRNKNTELWCMTLR